MLVVFGQASRGLVVEQLIAMQENCALAIGLPFERVKIELMRRTLLAMLAAAAVCSVGPLLADDPDGQYEPGRAVARISVINGDVSVRRGDSGDVVAAAVNAPLMANDALLTSSNGRAEVQLDYGNLVRVAPNSEVRLAALDVHSFQLQLAAGTVTYRVLRPSQAQSEVDTPSVAVRPLREGAYRISVHEDGTSEISVRSGEAEIDSPQGSERLEAGQTMNARGPASDPEFQVVQAIAPDNWDRWNDERDRYLLRSQSYQHVSPAIYGAEDLDQYGRWTTDPTYGQVWVPSEPAGWAPYQAGRWAWEDYYGWTWVSYDPWGWAPYHYGRWFYGPVGWAWYPGPIYANPFWAPAYVGFFGWGGGFGIGVGFGFGGIGWVALAPFELFHPWWGAGFYGGFRSGFFGNHTTIVNNVNVMNSFRNARVAGAAMGVNAADFGRRAQFTSLSGSQLERGGLVHGVLPVSPDRSSLRLSDRAVSGNFPQARAQSFAGRMQAPRAEHVSFDQQQRGMQQISRSNFSQGGFSPANRAGGGGGNAGGFGGAANSGAAASHGWNRFGEPIHEPGGAASSQNTRSSDGTQRFGTPAEAARQGYGAGANRSYGGGGQAGQAVRISPSIVQQRSPSSPAPRYQEAPRSNEGSRGFGGGGAPRSAPSNGGGWRSFGGGGSRSSGGGHSGGHGGRR